MQRQSRPHVRPPEAGAVVEDVDFARVDWWGAELDGVTFTRCRFDDAGLEELVTRRCVFDACVLTGVRLGGSRHLGSAFLSCRFDRARLFDVTLGGLQADRLAVPGRRTPPDDDDRQRLELDVAARGRPLGPVPLGSAVPRGRPDRRRPARDRPEQRRPRPGPPAERQAPRRRPPRSVDRRGQLALVRAHRGAARPDAGGPVRPHPRGRSSGTDPGQVRGAPS